MTMRFTCSHCQAGLQLAKAPTKGIVKCPKCGQAVKFPVPSASPSPPAAATESATYALAPDENAPLVDARVPTLGKESTSKPDRSATDSSERLGITKHRTSKKKSLLSGPLSKTALGREPPKIFKKHPWLAPSIAGALLFILVVGGVGLYFDTQERKAAAAQADAFLINRDYTVVKSTETFSPPFFVVEEREDGSRIQWRSNRVARNLDEANTVVFVKSSMSSSKGSVYTDGGRRYVGEEEEHTSRVVGCFIDKANPQRRRAVEARHYLKVYANRSVKPLDWLTVEGESWDPGNRGQRGSIVYSPDALLAAILERIERK